MSKRQESPSTTRYWLARDHKLQPIASFISGKAAAAHWPSMTMMRLPDLFDALRAIDLVPADGWLRAMTSWKRPDEVLPNLLSPSFGSYYRKSKMLVTIRLKVCHGFQELPI